ncbi:MAG TPA: glycosyltransferase family 2 protein [Roseiflexaceae bacterium]|nr:glycosyltransferase family 2 protein [Roseiflexaceae bacterium]HMP39956.1 glycosyltransferase family 2 protein [Roseiflexaceae bacterium]
MMPLAQLAAVIIARDEARHIEAALVSLAGLAAETLVLLDDRTTDATATLAAAHGARVVHAAWRNFSAQRNLALALCSHEWVLFVDADERLTAELAAELRSILADPGQAAGFWIPRYNQFFGRVVRGGGWYPDPQLRLLRRTAARYDEQRLVHEVAIVDGPTATLQQHLLHINIEHYGEFWRKQRAYAFSEAEILYRSGRRTRLRNLAGAPLREFYRRFITLGGWRDGALGIVLCGTLALFELMKFVYLYTLARRAGPDRR